MRWSDKRDAELIKFIWDRLFMVHRESPSRDYMKRLREIGEELSNKARAVTPDPEPVAKRCDDCDGPECESCNGVPNIKEVTSMAEEKEFKVKVTQFRDDNKEDNSKCHYIKTGYPDRFFWDKVMEIGKKYGKGAVEIVIYDEGEEIQSCIITPRKQV